MKRTLMCNYLKALSYDERLKIFVSLDNRDQSISQIAKKSDQCSASVSGHLRSLKESGLVKRVKRGQQVYYRLDPIECHLADALEKMALCVSRTSLRS